jgi:ribose transport system substrate-binding protein
MNAKMARVALAAGLVACCALVGRGPVGIAHAAKHYKIVLVAGISSDPFYITMGHGASAEAKKEGATVQYSGSSQAFSPATQIPYLNAAIAAKPDLILIAPTDVVALYAPIKAAVAAHIPVVLVDTTLKDPSIAITSVSSDNVGGGAKVCDALAQVIGKKGKVAIINTQPGVSTVDQRVQGFNAEIKKYPNMKNIASIYATDSPTKAATFAKALFTAHPDLAGVFATNTNTGAGVYAAAQEAHIAGKLKLVEFDAEPVEVQGLKKGVISALVSQDPYSIGVLGVKYGIEYLNGNHHLAKHYGTGEAIITKANVNSPSVKRFEYTT